MEGCVPIGCGQRELWTSWASPRLSIVKEMAALRELGQGEGEGEGICGREGG